MYAESFDVSKEKIPNSCMHTGGIHNVLIRMPRTCRVRAGGVL